MTTVDVSSIATAVAASTRARLVCGLIAGPLYLIVSYVQALTRTGFDLTRNAFSYLSLGPSGGIQVANFIVCGLLFVIGATGARRVLNRRSRAWAAWLVGAMGTAMVAGGIFCADPAYGYPPGAPAGQPATLSWHGALHAVAFTSAILTWIGACFAFARWFAGTRRRGWAVYSTAVGVALLAPIITFVVPPGAALIYAAASLGWTWTAAVFARLLADVRTEQHRSTAVQRNDVTTSM